MREPTKRDREAADLTRRALSDPGAFTPRDHEDGIPFAERIDKWQTRAIEQALLRLPDDDSIGRIGDPIDEAWIDTQLVELAQNVPGTYSRESQLAAVQILTALGFVIAPAEEAPDEPA